MGSFQKPKETDWIDINCLKLPGINRSAISSFSHEYDGPSNNYFWRQALPNLFLISEKILFDIFVNLL